MSLITRCPACETLFKVVPDQLRISDGWVRCGQCDEIFDASLHLLPAAPEPAVQAGGHEGAAAQPDRLDVWQGEPAPLDINLDTDLPDSPVDLLLEVPAHGTVAAAEERQRTAPEPLASDSPAPAGEVIVPGKTQPDDDDDDEAARSAELGGVSFLRGNRATSFWHQRLMRATLLVLGVALLLGLAVQVVLHERDRLAAFEPRLQPWLQALCDPFNCSLSPLRRIEAIVIDSSSFSRIRGDAYRLNFTLKNSAATPLAVPAMELTLTDALDQAVVRRVLGAGELGARSDTLGAGAEWSASVALVLQAGGTAERVAGYRLLAFYP